MRLMPICTILLIALLLHSCKDDDAMVVPIIETDVSTYTFARDGASSVDFSQQTDLANMLSNLSTYTLSGNTGAIVEATIFRGAFENTNDNGAGLFNFSSSIQLENNLNTTDLADDYFGDLFEQAAIASKAGDEAANQVPGLILRESLGTNILVNNLGQEFTQFIETGVMGSVFMHQMYSILLDDNLVGDSLENTIPLADENFTALEQNWDRAFGYFHAPGDFGSNWPASRNSELRFWSSFSQTVDPSLGISDRIMDAFRNGRNAIVENDFSTKNESRAILLQELEILAAASSIHFINESIVQLEEGNTGDLFHYLSDAYMSVRALNMNPNKLIAASDLHNILNVDFGIGGNFWTANLQGLETAKAKLVLAYPSLEAVADEL